MGNAGAVEDGGPAIDGFGAELGEFGGVVEGVEVNVREHDDGDGVLGLHGSVEGQSGEEQVR